MALLGTNGAGKSTLLAALAAAYEPGREHYDGQAAVRFNPACRLVYFDQTMSDLPTTTKILDYVVEAEGVTEKDAIRHLAGAGFAFVRLKEPIGVLSHGERARLGFLKMKLLRPNFYVLDEPTNHLDIEAIEAMEAGLRAYDGALLVVSHDEAFLEAIDATRRLELPPSEVAPRRSRSSSYGPDPKSHMPVANDSIGAPTAAPPRMSAADPAASTPSISDDLSALARRIAPLGATTS